MFTRTLLTTHIHPSPKLRRTRQGFLQYCYYQKFNKYSHDLISQLLHSVLTLLNGYKETQINGFSAIGAAILAPDITIKTKRDFIQLLLNFGFKPTKKDIMLAELQLYDAIPAEKKAEIVAFLNRKDMPSEVTKQIVSCMVDLYRKDYWPLPDIINDEQ